MERTDLSLVAVLMVVTIGLVTPGTRTNKKAPLLRKGALVKPGEIFVQRISPAAHRFACAYQPPWDFSVPGWHPLVSPKGIPDVLTFIAEDDPDRKPPNLSSCVIKKSQPNGAQRHLLSNRCDMRPAHGLRNNPSHPQQNPDRKCDQNHVAATQGRVNKKNLNASQ